MKVAQDLDTTSNQCEKGRIGMGIGLGIGLMAAALPFAAVATPIIVLGAAIGIRSAKNLTDAANDNNILVEQYQDLQEFFVSLNDEIQDVYQNINSICHSLDVLPERIKELTNKNNIFSKIFLFVIEFLIIARNCHLPLKHIITICEANRPPPSNLKKLLKRNKEELAGKVTNVIAENMKHFDRISNQTLDYQIKLKAIETSALSSNEFRAYHIRRNLLADSNPNGKNSVSQNADYRWDFVGPWKYGTPVFLHTHYDPEFEDKFDTCYETSCSNCKKTLTIDLNDIGMTHIVNTFQPLITFSEWVVNRADCGSIYQSSIYLLDSSHRVIAVEEGKTEFQQWQLQKWEKLELRIQSYPSETRYIRIESSGKDTQFWAGHYGVKIAESELKIHFDDIPPMNLLNDVNPKGDEVTRYADSRWHFNGAWKYDVPVFLDNHFHPNFEDKFEYCFETSYMECKKVMEIDLKKVGILGLMDYFRPSIIFSEWVINRADCGSKYQCSLTLLNKWHKIIAEISDGRQFRKWHLQKWEKVKLEIHAYPPGVRYIQITSSGQDTQFWEGHYGVKIAGSELLLKLT
uniref:FBA domain-containing protein n=1 Tax=Panagrolaimus davidi TaxID=227884 RepID=A0A914Q2E3_9BILA